MWVTSMKNYWSQERKRGLPKEIDVLHPQNRFAELEQQRQIWKSKKEQAVLRDADIKSRAQHTAVAYLFLAIWVMAFLLSH